MLSYDKYSKNDGSFNLDNKYFDYQNDNEYLDLKNISSKTSSNYGASSDIIGYKHISNFKDGSAPPDQKNKDNVYNEYLPENKDYQDVQTVDGIDHMGQGNQNGFENLSPGIMLKKTRIGVFDDYFSISDLIIIFNVLISIYLLFKLHKLKNKIKKIKNHCVKLP